jgi:hypothetical protein
VPNETEYDTVDIEQRNAPQGAQVIQLESSRLVPVLVVFAGLGLLTAGLSLGVAFWSLSYSDKARMEARVLQVKVEGFENALHARGIDPNPHLKGEPE